MIQRILLPLALITVCVEPASASDRCNSHAALDRAEKAMTAANSLIAAKHLLRANRYLDGGLRALKHYPRPENVNDDTDLHLIPDDIAIKRGQLRTAVPDKRDMLQDRIHMYRYACGFDRK